MPGQWRWRWDLNPRKGCPFTRFRGLRASIHHRPRVYLTWADRRSVFADERLRTEVNETKTEPRARDHKAAADRPAHLPTVPMIVEANP
jgi:hypothetical protein